MASKLKDTCDAINFRFIKKKMSGVEEVLNDPPDKNETEDKQIEVKEEVTSELKTASDSETPSLTGSWTILEKEEADAVKVGIDTET